MITTRIPVATMKKIIPLRFRPAVKGLLAKIGFQQFKYSEELNYWRERFNDGQWMLHDYYEARLLSLAGELDQQFLSNRNVADFGCGPRGSLCWASQARNRIGIDVLSEHYSEFDISKQNMVYVTSTERRIPLPTDYVDILFTMNALDHCSKLKATCSEILRILRPGGILVGSFNLNEPGTFSEPQTLTESLLDAVLLRNFNQEFRFLEEGRLIFRGTKRCPPQT